MPILAWILPLCHRFFDRFDRFATVTSSPVTRDVITRDVITVTRDVKTVRLAFVVPCICTDLEQFVIHGSFLAPTGHLWHPRVKKSQKSVISAPSWQNTRLSAK